MQEMMQSFENTRYIIYWLKQGFMENDMTYENIFKWKMTQGLQIFKWKMTLHF